MMAMKVIEFGSIRTNKIVPSKLKEARTARGLSLAEMSRLIEVSSQAISQYENGQISPSSSTFMKIIDVLDFPISFFCYDENEIWKENMVYFRSNKNITKKTMEACKVRIKWVKNTYEFLRGYFMLPRLDIPNWGCIDIDSIDEREIEELTLKLREYWGLGESPISNLVDLLQEKGFIITRLEIGTKKIDAFSTWQNNVPYIFLGNDKESACRSRFDLAHELGHLLMHRGIESEDVKNDKALYEKLEYQANYFAAAFLLPIEAFNREVISSSIDSFILLKSKWNVSISAMIKRCQTANVLSDNQIRYLNSQMIKYKYYNKEPLDEYINKERPYLFKQAFEVLINNKIYTKEALLDRLRLNSNEVVKLFSLDKNFFKKSINILRIIK